MPTPRAGAWGPPAHDSTRPAYGYDSPLSSGVARPRLRAFLSMRAMNGRSSRTWSFCDICSTVYGGMAGVVAARFVKLMTAATKAISFISETETPVASRACLAADAAAGVERVRALAKLSAASSRGERSARVRLPSTLRMRSSLMPWIRSMPRTAA
jgi:hypothetical protein